MGIAEAAFHTKRDHRGYAVPPICTAAGQVKHKGFMIIHDYRLWLFHYQRAFVHDVLTVKPVYDIVTAIANSKGGEGVQIRIRGHPAEGQKNL